jgi:hypothetical protein
MTATTLSRAFNRLRYALFILAVIGTSSCATTEHRQVTKTDIETQTIRLIARREHWAGKPYVLANQDKYDGTWRVEAHAHDPRHTDCGCVLFMPGTRREILFSRSGRLISYVALQ